MRDAYLDVLKGLGIIAVVTAHANIRELELNWFHLELFFFVSGFLVNSKKCANLGEFFLHKLKTLWRPFVLYNVAFFILHDLFISMNWITTQGGKVGTMTAAWIGLYELPGYIFSTIFNGKVENMCGATWFMVPFFSNIMLFALLVKFSEGKSKYFLPAMIILLFAVGASIVKHKPGVAMFFDMAMMLLPITAAGFYLKKFCAERKISLSSIFTEYKIVGVVCLAISLAVFAFLSHEKRYIFLAGYHMGNWFWFLAAAFSGIFLTMLAGRIILAADFLKKFFAFVGERSFHIMALHFVGFKIFTEIYLFAFGGDKSLLPRLFLPLELEWRMVYVIFGVTIPLILYRIWEKFFEGRVLS